MAQDKYTRPDNTTQSASAYKNNIDNGFETFENGCGNLFQAHERTTPAMRVDLEAGLLWNGPGNTTVSVAAQTTATVTAPSTNPRIDLVVINTSGAVSIITGTESTVPVAPSITAGRIPICHVTLATSTTQITDELITDKRPAYMGDPAASSSFISDVVDDTSPQLGGNLDYNSRSIVDASGNEELAFSTTASAVNHLEIQNAATGNGPTLSAVGDDANIDFNIDPKGTGNVVIDSLRYPEADGTNGQVVTTDGSGNLTLQDVGGAWTFVSTQTISSDTEIDFTGLNESGASYKFTLEDVRPASDGSVLYLRVSTDNGSTFKSGGSDYEWSYFSKNGNGSTHVGDVSDSEITLAGSGTSIGNQTDEGVTGYVTVYNPQGAVGATYVEYQFQYASTGGSVRYIGSGQGSYQATTAVDAIRFLFNSGNLASGTIRLYKLSGS